MLPASTKLMSADDHMIEPPHLWVDRVPAEFRDRAPRIVDPGNGRDAWLFEDELTYIPMGSCRPLPGLPVQGFPPAPGTARFDEIRPGCYDPVARIDDMDIDGVWGAAVLPELRALRRAPLLSEREGRGARLRLPAHLQRLPARRVVRRPRPTACSARSSSRSTTWNWPCPSWNG